MMPNSTEITRMVYLDNNATTRIDPRVLDVMIPYLDEYYGNPSSIHKLGARVGQAMEIAREQVQQLIGAHYTSEIIFTSCATEATTTAILSALEASPDKRDIVTSKVEHPATLQLCQNLERKGYRVHWIGVDQKGRLDMKAYRAALSEQVAVVSLMWANNETGTIFPVETVARLAKEYGAQMHVDAVQMAGKCPIDVKSLDIDMLSISGHKFHAPKGIGALYLRRGTRFRPLMRGGHQERGRRAGTENAASIIAMGKAAELAYQALDTETYRIRQMRDRLEHGLLARIPNTFVTGDPQQRVPNTTNIAVEYVEGEALLLMMNQVGIAASSGSACTSGSLEPSHVMKAMQIPFTAAHGTLRFSLSRFTRDEEIDMVLEHLPPIVARLRQLSPYWDNETNQGSVTEFVPAYA
ncbi:cysteine desulfurase NifS [Vibrio mangrovi]|uniref:Cysteine desulfurase n=1 Tax=Vibrio mangrovi TaxID=474394 RepID=A0A1Y6INJ4_9VIBR|nr:cysteine desulfurase NifS [Vibrio mangrovi]MDW6003986.1 cysteine desulfurase NifS [Vibrio mangrovi]SMR99217.1 Cysteine desulfurase [Vibrio mangrovi]